MNVGILGGGQLGMMIAEAVARLGGTPHVYDRDPHAPARARVASFFEAPFDDEEALRRFFERCDVVTYERELLPLSALRRAGKGVRFVPDLDVLATTQDRALEKGFLARHGLPTVRHRLVGDEGLVAASSDFGLPAIAKTTQGGYDGKGQFFLREPTDVAEAERAFPTARWALEERLPLIAEASCIVARSQSEEIAFPIVENLHRDHVLDRSILPCRLPYEVEEAMRDIALRTARALDARGVLAVELFVAPEGYGGVRIGEHALFVNEIAPRPHNSGHLLAKACTFGQFDALARVLLGAPLGAPQALEGAYCMGNLLGDVWLSGGHHGALRLDAWAAHPDVLDVHLYGKRTPAPRRKMGHFLVHRPSPDDALARAAAFREALRAPPRP